MMQPTILIVEDDEPLATLFREALEAITPHIDIALNGQEALAYLDANQPDLVLLDLHLPRVSGTNVFKRIRQDPRLVDTKVVLVTADAAMASWLHEEADLVLEKPVLPSQLQVLARRLLSA